MEYKDLVKANEDIKTTNIKGKEYAEVNERINAFRKLYPEGTINTEIVSCENGVVIFRATVGFLEEGNIHVLGTGTAYEKEGSTFINKTSYIENCETSAVGRALGMAGIGIDTSIASVEEVQNAIANQNKPEKKPEKKPENKKSVPMCTEEQKNKINDILQKGLCDKEKFNKIKNQYHFNSSSDLTKTKAELVIKAMSA